MVWCVHVLVCRKAEGLALQPLPILGRRAGWYARCPAAAQALNSHVHVSCVCQPLCLVFSLLVRLCLRPCHTVHARSREAGGSSVNERALKISGDVLDVVQCGQMQLMCFVYRPSPGMAVTKATYRRVVISCARLGVCSAGCPAPRTAGGGRGAAFCAGDHGRAAARLTRVQQSLTSAVPRAANSHG